MRFLITLAVLALILAYVQAQEEFENVESADQPELVRVRRQFGHGFGHGGFGHGGFGHGGFGHGGFGHGGGFGHHGGFGHGGGFGHHHGGFFG